MCADGVLEGREGRTRHARTRACRQSTQLFELMYTGAAAMNYDGDLFFYPLVILGV